MKCALVTGGSRGIGRAIFQKLAEELNYHVLINYQGNKDAAQETLELLEATGATGEILQFNVAYIQETQSTLQNWSVRNPEAVVEVIINNAGIYRDGMLICMSTGDWSSDPQVSLQGLYTVSTFYIHKLLRQRFGRIINIVSVSGVKGTAGQVNYSAAKAGVVGATKALALEVAKRNITVNAVAPGFIHTDMTAEMDEGELVKLIPANRF